MEIKVMVDSDQYWNWCCTNLSGRTWRKRISFTGTSATYIFDKPEDATMFKLTIYSYER